MRNQAEDQEVDPSQDASFRPLEALKATLSEAFSAALTASSANDQSFLRTFIQRWWRGESNGYFFLFKKNIRATNMQYAELLNLLKIHWKDAERNGSDLNFFTYDQADEFISGLCRDMRGLIEQSDDIPGIADSLADTFIVLLSRTALIDPFSCSCAVALPPGTTLNLAAVIAESGFIHSCGNAIFQRPINQLRIEDFILEMRNYLRDNVSVDRRLFSVFSHEDFTPYESGTSEFRDGLDEVKLYVDKTHVDNRPLPEAIEILRREFDAELYFAFPGDYRITHLGARQSERLDRNSTFWVIGERSFHADPRLERNPTYLVCYEQIYRNSNATLLFEEEMPGWLGPVTLPHSLAAAMFNVARRQGLTDEHVAVADPFAGAGTVALQALKFANVNMRASDILPESPFAIEFNRLFFDLTSDKLGRMVSDLWRLKGRLEKGEVGSLVRTLGADLGATELPSDGAPPESEIQWTAVALKYLAFKVGLTGAQSQARSTDSRLIARLAFEIGDLLQRTEKFITIREAQDHARSLGGIESVEGNDLFEVIPTLDDVGFSKSVTLRPGAAKEAGSRIQTKCADIANNSLAGINVLICDPPYGFNTDEDPILLLSVYSSLARKVVEATPENGQIELVICLPDVAFTGRTVASFTRAGVVSGLLHAVAGTGGVKLEVIRSELSNVIGQFGEKYYWESHRALRRQVLHFKLTRLRMSHTAVRRGDG